MTSTSLQSGPPALRAKQHGEVYTPPALVHRMLRKLGQKSKGTCWRKRYTFIDFTCGTGNILIFVLWRKITKGHNPLQAMKTIYGADRADDSIRLCRLRLLKIVSLFTSITEDHVRAVLKNIVWLNPKNHPAGSLDYLSEEHRDNAFTKEPRKDDIVRWMKYVNEDKALDEIELPVSEEEFAKSGNVDLFTDIEEDE